MDDEARGLLIDIDGVLVMSWRPLPGAVEALAGLRDAEVPLRFATNTTTRTRDEIAATLTAVGMPVRSDEILSAPAATASYLREHHPGARCLLLNEGDLRADLIGVQLVDTGQVDVVVVGGAGPSFTYEAFNRAFAALHDGASLVAMHRNLTWRTIEGLQLDSGGFVGALEEAADVEATVIGKPSAEFFAAAARDLGLAPSTITMVGDDVHNDVLAAQDAGMRGVLVRTGKFEPGHLDGLERRPDAVIDSLGDLQALLAAR
ncbi:TIGR01458 family HAD-type hydrolase [Actinomarinicola tropica]|uniref:Haloacid dehalogenase-like hydrolase domain-containing protein 2 n=1 Tax=Actinomarinicola tropica TaxID=2789776 RepID=A0A5Q2RRE9_9ACTN|nr:TIGR01458 family HAD-type hydrolase [Actinomarinicola tropica]QGG95765.1 TIGR01458 family HAD-type hydrolase [Actinomarinicola tropica]